MKRNVYDNYKNKGRALKNNYGLVYGTFGGRPVLQEKISVEIPGGADRVEEGETKSGP